MRDCPTISARGRESNKVPPSVSDLGAQAQNNFYVLQAKTKSDKEVGTS